MILSFFSYDILMNDNYRYKIRFISNLLYFAYLKILYKLFCNLKHNQENYQHLNRIFCLKKKKILKMF